MVHIELFKYDLKIELANAVANDWLSEVQNHDITKPYLAALSGGRIAHDFYSALTQKAAHWGSLLAKVHYFWADERCVPFMDEDSNFTWAQRLLFEPLSIPSHQIHRIRAEELPTTAALLASHELTPMLVPPNKTPVFDMVFLGMGEDGHIASIFPGATIEEKESDGIYYPTIGPKPPPQRITLSLHRLVNARKVWVLISGSGKSKALGESLTQPQNTPLGWLLERRSSTRIYYVSD